MGSGTYANSVRCTARHHHVMGIITCTESGQQSVLYEITQHTITLHRSTDTFHREGKWMGIAHPFGTLDKQLIENLVTIVSRGCIGIPEKNILCGFNHNCVHYQRILIRKNISGGAHENMVTGTANQMDAEVKLVSRKEISPHKRSIGTGSTDEGTGRIHTGRFLKIGSGITALIARGRDENSPLAHHVADDFIIKLGVIREILTGSLTKRSNARQTYTLRIVEDIFKTKCICGGSVTVAVSLCDKKSIIRNSIAHQANIAFIGKAPIAATGSISNGNTCRMRSMPLLFTVT